MRRKILFAAVALVLTLLLARLPIFPLIMEVREYSQEGERLFQTWSFVSMPEFYDAARFARTGWLETTWRNYLILAGVNDGGLAGVFVAITIILNRLVGRKSTAP